MSDTPDVKSRHWGNRYLRICTWARLKDKTTQRSFYIHNTHLDHQSQNARLKSARLIAKRIHERVHPDPFVLTGDFNAAEDNSVILYLKRKGEDSDQSPFAVVDTFRQKHPDEKEVGTGGGFSGKRNGPKIDYVFVAPGTKTLDASIVRTHKDGRYPSDHSPVVAGIRFPPFGEEERFPYDGRCEAPCHPEAVAAFVDESLEKNGNGVTLFLCRHPGRQITEMKLLDQHTESCAAGKSKPTEVGCNTE